MILMVISLCSMAEGTKQLRPDSAYMGDLWIINGGNGGGQYSCFATDQCAPNQRLYVHIAHPGEKIYMGFGTDLLTITFRLKLNGSIVYTQTVSLNGSAPGYIQYHSQAIAGPKLLNPHGYIPLDYAPAEAGDYCIEFQLPSPPASEQIGMRLFDITVVDTTTSPLTPIDGRLWSRDWGFNTYNFTTLTNAFLAKQYILTNDSIVTSVDYNHMQGWNFDVTSTQNGCYPWPEPWDSSCRSRTGNHHYAQYQIFINNPDPSVYPTGTLGSIIGDSVTVTRGCNGTFNLTFSVNKHGTVKLNIESNLAPGLQPEDLSLNYSVHKGQNTIYWDGMNAMGAPVPCGDSVAITINYINGLTNIALYDVERNLKGFIIELVRPTGAPIATYWNDTLLAGSGGYSQLDGCYANPPDTGCHVWTGAVGSGLGSGHTVNTWWYAASSLLDLGRFSVACVPHIPQGISGPTTLCASETVTYTCDPNPLTGSERNGYEWVLTDVSSGAVLFDSVDIGPTIKIHFSDFPPGQKRLKVRGRSAPCGLGPFGPGAGGEGILIDPVMTTQVTNTQNTFSICSGSATNISLTASLPGTTYSYTASASSPSITGYSSGVLNPISQVLVNAGTLADTVFYHVVPFLAPCAGDTATFMVVVNPAGLMNFLIAASANPLCAGAADTFSVTTPIGGPAAIYQWYVNGTARGSNLPEFIYTPADGDTVQCTIVSADFCTPGNIAYSQKIGVNLMPLVPVGISITPPPAPLCQGVPVTLTANPTNGGTLPAYQWFVNGAATGTGSSVFSYNPASGDQVICILTSNQDCILNSQASDTLVITVTAPLKIIDTTLCFGTPYFVQGGWQTTAGTYHDTLAPPVDCIHYIETHLVYKPVISVDLGKDTILCGNTITLSAHVAGGTYLWQDGSTDSVYFVTLPGEYRVLVAVDGCAHSDSVNIGECPVNIWFPNAFTPNGDGLNDTYHPVGTGIENFSMQIFNRWGVMVFETFSPEPGWDGNYKGSPCPEETYVFKAFFGISGGEVKQVTGTITLQRGNR